MNSVCPLHTDANLCSTTLRLSTFVLYKFELCITSCYDVDEQLINVPGS